MGPGSGPGASAIFHLPDDSRLHGAHPLPAAFLDRDGVIVEDVHYLSRAEDVRLRPGVAPALATMAERFSLVVVTNQSGIARGYFDEATLLAIHERLLAELAAEGAHLDALYACPHLDAGCDCRKPAPGMIARAASEHGLALDDSVLIGDAPRDVEAGQRAGVRSLLLDDDYPGLPEALKWLD